MNLHMPRSRTWMDLVTLLVFIAVSAQVMAEPSAPSTQPAAKVAKKAALVKPTANLPQKGYVKGNNVYVRSGSNQNYYPVTKLNKGHEVTIVGEEYGWLKILPPEGTHSLVDKTYVDRLGTDDNTGIINGLTRVYAGSNLDNRRYANQTKLNKGEKVQILGETEDGSYYKIVPPKGAHLWISGDWVDRTGTFAPKAGPQAPAIEPIKPGELKLSTDKTKAKHTDSQKPLSPKTITANNSKNQALMNAIETEIAAESTKPLKDRVLEPIIAKLQPLADQTEDEISQLYAKTRIKQLQDHIEMITALREMSELRENAFSFADEKTRERAMIKVKETKPMDDIVVRGEIRVSGIYKNRWRVVDPQKEKTLAYIELPKDSPINPVDYYGKYIGIRAISRRVTRGTVQPMPIYTVQEIVIQDRPKQQQTKTAIGSPAPTKVKAPSSQPANNPTDKTEEKEKIKDQ